MPAIVDSNHVPNPRPAERLLEAKFHQYGDYPAFPDLFPELIRRIRAEERDIIESLEQARESLRAEVRRMGEGAVLSRWD